MKVLLTFFLMMTLNCHLYSAQLKSVTKQEKVSSTRFFGFTKYKGEKRSIGMLLKRIPNSQDYYAIVAEYLNPFKEKGFIGKFLAGGKKKPFKKSKRGHLQSLYEWISIYKMIKIEGKNQFKLTKLKVSNGEIKAQGARTLDQIESGLNILTLSKRGKIRGATLNLNIKNKIITIKFKSVLVKNRFPLKSTWEDFTPGPYNPGYKQEKIKILELTKQKSQALSNQSDSGHHSMMAEFNVEYLNDRPLFIKGKFSVKEASSGMYTFQETPTNNIEGASKVIDKIGVFIDVYNFQPFMNTVELVLIDPNNPFNSQMYFEQFGNKDQ